MMHREVDYHLEARTTEKFRQMLKNDPRFVVPRVLPEYSGAQVIASTYEHGHSVSAGVVRSCHWSAAVRSEKPRLSSSFGSCSCGVRSRPTPISETTVFALPEKMAMVWSMIA